VHLPQIESASSWTFLAMARFAGSLIIISAVLGRAFDFSRKLRFDGAARLVKFRLGPRHVSQHCVHPFRTQHDKSERDKER
jgi:hypothetical protein